MSADQNKEHAAKLVEALAREKPYCDRVWARMALAVAANTIRRGRLLTEAEKLENLAAGMEDGAGDTPDEQQVNRETAARLRAIARSQRIEDAAKEIYDRFPYDGPPGTTKPAWVPDGNSKKQDEARRMARESLAESATKDVTS